MKLDLKGWGCLAVAASLIASLGGVQAATQTYCSSFNTGSSFNGIYGQWTSLGSCQGNCTSAGQYAFAVVQGNYCWCSNYAPSPQLAISRCGKACPGWPYENCGDVDNNLFGYLALGPTAAGTSGSSSASLATSTKPSATMATSQQVVVSTSGSSQVSSTGVNSPGPITVLSAVATTERITVVPTESSTPDPSTSVWPSVVTISGAATTKYVTSIITAPAIASNTVNITPTPQARSDSLSGGAIAGIVIGTLAGVALLAALIFFVCFRRRRDTDEHGNTLNRNSSVLSKVGLVRNRASATAPSSATIPDIPTSMAQRTPTLPALADSRMNPNLAGSWRGNSAFAGAGLGLSHPNDSQGSLGSFQDARDYSRPLEVRNPDPY